MEVTPYLITIGLPVVVGMVWFYWYQPREHDRIRKRAEDMMADPLLRVEFPETLQELRDHLAFLDSERVRLGRASTTEAWSDVSYLTQRLARWQRAQGIPRTV